MLFGLAVVLARHLGLHADSTWTCRMYTFMLVGIVVYTGIFLQIGWTTSRRCPVWFFFSLLSSYYPLFPPKKKSDAEKADIARAELEQFVAEHGQMPSQHSDLASSRSLSWKLKKLKLLHLLKHDWRREICEDTLKFYDLHGRIPRRQNIQRDEQRAEDALARRWDRLLEQKAALAEDLLNAHNRIFAASEVEGDDAHLIVCIAATEFFQSCKRWPKRQAADTAEKRAEDALARRWDRLVAEQESGNSELLSTYSGIFAASEMEEDDAHLAVCIAVMDFFQSSQRLPKRQGVDTDKSEQRMHLLDAGIVCLQR